MTTHAILSALLVGIGGTITLDIWALLLSRTMGIPPVNWAMVGRWFGHMPRGQFIHKKISNANPIKGELAIGWIAHYIIGIGYGALILVFWGSEWFEYPTFLPPMIVAWAMLIAPYFMMMPGMGSGIAGSRTPKPNHTRLKSIIGHSVFGVGMYMTAKLLAGTIS